MDSTGVPKKINRHVIKALTTDLAEGLAITEILKFVRFCNRKLKPVPNIKQVVLKSLANLRKIGLIQRDKKSRYKITNLVIPKSSTTGRVTKRASVEAAKQQNTLDPNSRKRSNDPSEEETVESARKRFRSQKNISNREGTKVNLPHARRQNIAVLKFPKDDQLFAANIATNFDDDVSMKANDEKDNEFEDDESMKAFSDEETEEADKIMIPDTDNKPEPVIENQENNENSEETSTTVPNATANFNSLNFSYESYLN